MELNIDLAVKELVIKALNKYRKRKDASKALGISRPTLRRYINKINK